MKTQLMYVKRNRFIRSRRNVTPGGSDTIAVGIVRVAITNNSGDLQISLQGQVPVATGSFTCSVTSIIPVGDDPNAFVFKLVMLTSELLTLVGGTATWENPFTSGPAFYYHPPSVSADDGITFNLRGVGAALSDFNTPRILNLVYFATPSLKS